MAIVKEMEAQAVTQNSTSPEITEDNDNGSWDGNYGQEIDQVQPN